MKNISVNDLSVDYSIETVLAKSDMRAKQLLDEFGCFLAKGLLAGGELNPVRSDIRQLIELRMQRVGLGKELPVDGTSHFDEGLLQLSQLEYVHAKELSANGIPYDQGGCQLSQLEYAHCDVIANVCRMLLSIHQINVNPKLVHLQETDVHKHAHDPHNL